MAPAKEPPYYVTTVTLGPDNTHYAAPSFEGELWREFASLLLVTGSRGARDESGTQLLHYIIAPRVRAIIHITSACNQTKGRPPRIAERLSSPNRHLPATR